MNLKNSRITLYPLLSAKLRQLRDSHELSQKVLANEIGITDSCYGVYERGERMLPYDILFRICSFYDIPLSVLLTVIQKESSSPACRFSYDTPGSGSSNAPAEAKESEDYEFLPASDGKLHVAITEDEFAVLQYYRTRETAVRNEISRIAHSALASAKKRNCSNKA